MDKWIEKNCKTSKMAKLLRDQLEENIRSQTHRLPKTAPSSTKKVDGNNESHLCDVSNMMWCCVSQKNPLNLSTQKPNKGSMKIEDKQREERILNGKIETKGYRYQKETAKGLSSSYRSKEVSSSCNEHTQGKKSINGKWTEVKIPVSNLKTDGQLKMFYPGMC